jgi:hypothetical protein
VSVILADRFTIREIINNSNNRARECAERVLCFREQRGSRQEGKNNNNQNLKKQQHAQKKNEKQTA